MKISVSFLRDFVQVERAVGRFAFRADEGDQNDFVRRLEQFAAEQRRADEAGREGP